jgi:hypothetical protein
MTARQISALVAPAIFLISCGDSTPPAPKEQKPVSVQEATPAPPAPPAPSMTPTVWSEVKLHEVIREKNPGWEWSVSARSGWSGSGDRSR